MVNIGKFCLVDGKKIGKAFKTYTLNAFIGVWMYGKCGIVIDNLVIEKC